VVLSVLHTSLNNGVSRHITFHHSSSEFYQDACRQGQDCSESHCLRQVAQPVQAHLRKEEVQSYQREGMEERCQLNRGDHWEGMAAHHPGRRTREAWSLEGMEEDRQEADPWLPEGACRQEEMVDEGTDQEDHQSRRAVVQKEVVLRGAEGQNQSLLEVDHLRSRKPL